MAKTRKIVFTLTEAQIETLKSFHAPHLDILDAHDGDEARDITVLESIDDTDVNSYVVKPDGTFSGEKLNDFGQGWEALP